MSEKIQHEVKTEFFEGEVKEFYRNNKEVIEEILREVKNKLGEGLTAYVHFLDANEDYCLKIIKNTKDIPSGTYYIPLDREMEFQKAVQSIQVKGVRAPKPYLMAEYIEDNEEEGLKFMIMERLKAVSLKDILEGGQPVPEGFKLADFRDKMFEYLEKMHDKNIYHRDLHSGNMMIDLKGDNYYVIDFGAAARGFGDESPYYEETRPGKTEKLLDDDEKVKDIIIEMAKHIKGK